MRELYARVARPLAGEGTPGAWLGKLRVMAIDGVQLDVPDTADNEDQFGRGVSLGLDAPYPKVKVLGLGECGTHAVIDAHLGGVLVDERELARPLLASVEPGCSCWPTAGSTAENSGRRPLRIGTKHGAIHSSPLPSAASSGVRVTGEAHNFVSQYRNEELRVGVIAVPADCLVDSVLTTTSCKRVAAFGQPRRRQYPRPLTP